MIELAAIVGREEQRRPLHRAVGGKRDRAPEIPRADRRGLFRLALRGTKSTARRRAPSWPPGPRAASSSPIHLRVPIRRLEQAHRPARRLAPGRRLALLVPHPHLPEAFLLRGQRLAGVAHLDGLVRGHLAAVPKIALAGIQFIPVARDQYLVSALRLARERRACPRSSIQLSRGCGVSIPSGSFRYSQRNCPTTTAEAANGAMPAAAIINRLAIKKPRKAVMDRTVLRRRGLFIGSIVSHSVAGPQIHILPPPRPALAVG